jgi:uncharacterized membrane protein YidH (DUF202 family)
MKPQDIFGIILRSLAVWLCIWGVWMILAGVKNLLPTLRAMAAGAKYPHDSFGYLVYGGPALFSGVVILMFADAFVRFTYPPPKPPQVPRSNEPQR